MTSLQHVHHTSKAKPRGWGREIQLLGLALALILGPGCAARFSNPIALKAANLGIPPGTPLPTGTSIDFGPLGGGQTITISGTDFQNGATASIGGVPCAPTTFVSATTITCVTPPMAAGTYPIVVLNPNGLSNTVAGGYTYQGPPTVTAVGLNYGPTAGGQLITFTGTLFKPGITATVDGFPCLASSYVSATSMQCLTPVHGALGTYNVGVTNLDTQSGGLASAYSYVPAPTTTSASLAYGPLAGGQVITITGTGFINQPGLAATVGGVACAGVTYLSATSLLCTVEAHAAGSVPVAVTNGDGQSGTASATYNYQGAPAFSSMNIDFGPPAGGVTVTINGTGFQPGISVTIGGAACTGVVVLSATQLTCTTPPGAGAGANLVLTNADGQTSTATGIYDYHGPPTVASTNLPVGPPAGGQMITVTGTLFEPGAVARLGGTLCTTTTFVSATQLTCLTPAHALGAVTVQVTNLDGQSGSLASGYTFAAPPNTTSSNLAFGPLAGGQTITVTGTGFQPGVTASVGGSPCGSPTYVSATQLTCVTPAGGAGTVTISATNVDGQTGTAGASYTYQGAPTYTSTNIAFGPPAGGINITITGTGFQPGLGITIGGAACTSLVVVNATTATCSTPAGAAGPAGIVLTNADGQTSTSAAAYNYHGPPTVTAVAPPTGPSTGGTTLNVGGTLFEPGLTVRVNGVNCTTSTYVSAILATCVTPAQVAGLYSVSVLNLDAQSGSLAAAFTYLAAPTVTAVNLAFGPLAGGTFVTITGTLFQVGATATINGQPCTSPNRLSATTLTCFTPTSQPAGTYNVVVTNPDTQSGTLVGGYTYESGPTITGLSPNFGPATGGQTVTITGTGFRSGLSASIGMSCSPSAYVNSTTATCVTQAQGAGSYTVGLGNPDGQADSVVGAFTVHGPPTVSSINLNFGPPAGGQTLTITGTLFEPGITVTIGGTACGSLIYLGPTQITCVTPAKAAASYPVVLTNVDGQNVTVASGYTYQGAPTVTGVSAPGYGPLAGGQSLTVSGTNFSPGITATINGAACSPSTYVNATTMTCGTPAQSAGTYTVAVTNADTQTGSLASAYTYVAAPTVSSVSPGSGPSTGGTSVTFTGTGFRSGLTLRINGVACATSTYNTATSATCVTAAVGGPSGPFGVSATNLDLQSGSLANAYTFVGVAALGWVVGASSPNPPNPDPYGTTNTWITHTFTLTNTGTATSSAITVSMAGTDPTKWSLGTDGCTGNTLAIAANCTVQVTFEGGAGGQTAGSYSALVRATAAAGGTADNDVTGTTAYTWSGSSGAYAVGAGQGGPNQNGNPCTTKGGTYNRLLQLTPGGVQAFHVHRPGYDSLCPGQWAMSAGAGFGYLAACATTTPTYGLGSWDTTTICRPIGTGSFWASLTGAIGGCETDRLEIVDMQYCN